jgi:hypothetical protein
MTIQSSPKLQGPSTTSKIPLTNATSELGVSTRMPIHSMSRPKPAMRSPPSRVTRMPKNCMIVPPPIQTIAAVTCRKSRNSYQSME